MIGVATSVRRRCVAGLPHEEHNDVDAAISPSGCCNLLPMQFEFKTALSIAALKDRIEILESEAYGFTKIYVCRDCGTHWRETSTPIGHADKYVTTRLLED